MHESNTFLGDSETLTLNASVCRLSCSAFLAGNVLNVFLPRESVRCKMSGDGCLLKKMVVVRRTVSGPIRAKHNSWNSNGLSQVFGAATR